MRRNVRLRFDHLARLAIGDRSRPRALEIDHAVMAAIDVIGEAIGMVVSLPTAINQIAELMPVPDR